ncbi:helix-turn-helix domain-containing protein [Cupriavidus pauculus]|uniref:helix-turn-helix domain-containing protein n=1 Tax=Cupriavidus pauculus TaxID=82633 RepID=UPI003857C865
MQTNRKSVHEAEELARMLRLRRKELGITLVQLAIELEVDVGQISRFERGKFKLVSKNLQKIADYLQISTSVEPAEDSVVKEFAALIGRSERHRAAAVALVRALQELQ